MGWFDRRVRRILNGPYDGGGESHLVPLLFTPLFPVNCCWAPTLLAAAAADRSSSRRLGSTVYSRPLLIGITHTSAPVQGPGKYCRGRTGEGGCFTLFPARFSRRPSASAARRKKIKKRQNHVLSAVRSSDDTKHQRKTLRP